mgnify:CR=1 FL=1
MSAAPVICFGQQPCGFFPRRFLFAKFETARRLQRELGGEIVFFFHDSDHDPRETQTLLRHRHTGQLATLNFTFENKYSGTFKPDIGEGITLSVIMNGKFTTGSFYRNTSVSFLS